MDNHNEKQNHLMMWMMVICCALPLVVLLFVSGFGGAALFSGGYLSWVIFGGLALACIGMMFRSHGRGSLNENYPDMPNAKQASSENPPSTDEKKDHSCCH